MMPISWLVKLSISIWLCVWSQLRVWTGDLSIFLTSKFSVQCATKSLFLKLLCWFAIDDMWYKSKVQDLNFPLDVRFFSLSKVTWMHFLWSHFLERGLLKKEFPWVKKKVFFWGMGWFAIDDMGYNLEVHVMKFGYDPPCIDCKSTHLRIFRFKKKVAPNF